MEGRGTVFRWSCRYQKTVIIIVTTVRISSLTAQGFVFERHSVQIPTRTLAVLPEVFRDFSQSLKANAEVTPLLGHNHFPPNHYSPIIKSVSGA
jgi:hypothetical protein